MISLILSHFFRISIYICFNNNFQQFFLNRKWNILTFEGKMELICKWVPGHQPECIRTGPGRQRTIHTWKQQPVRQPLPDMELLNSV